MKKVQHFKEVQDLLMNSMQLKKKELRLSKEGLLLRYCRIKQQWKCKEKVKKIQSTFCPVVKQDINQGRRPQVYRARFLLEKAEAEQRE